MDPFATRPTDATADSRREAPLPAPAAPPAPSATTPARSSSRGRPRRVWPAVLTLFILAPAIGEMLSGSTPPLLFINPLSLVFETGLYGSGAILVRELARRRGLGWANILMLGAAYGVLEEGLVVTSWFNPHWPDLGTLSVYGRALDISVIWAIGLTAYHAVVSVTIPIVLTETFYPALAARPWLTRRGFRMFAIWLGVISALGLLAFGFAAYHKQGYSHPPASYLLAVILAVALVYVGLRWRPAPYQPRLYRPAPRLWTLRAFGLLATLTFFVTLWVFPAKIPAAWVTALAMVGVLALEALTVRRWSSRYGWSREHRLALASGAVGFFLLLAPLLELGAETHGKPTAGMTLVASFFAALLIVLARRQGRRVRVTQSNAE
ncbi:MAG TPA: hypothetical protein VJN88_06915 [Ktedonobacterales bacterium]|nr:hypothetical protein [Ktedonobacterales bacterium]